MSDAGGVPEAEYGQLEPGEAAATVRFRRRLAHPPAKVWRALTEERHLAAWFPTTVEGDLVAGAPLRFAFREVSIEPMDGEMLAFDPPHRLAFRWGPDTVRFELAEVGDEGCELILVVGFAELGKAARDGAGWHSCVDLLRCEVDGVAAPWSSDARWRQVRASYVERFGPDASTIGPPGEWEEAYGAP